MAIDYVYPDKNRVFGMDISHWAGGAVDFNIAKQNGLNFVIIKAKDSIYTSNWFLVNYAGAKKAGIPRGAYAWLYPNSVMSVKRQAQSLFSLLSGTSGEMAQDFPELNVYIDFEWSSPTNPTYDDLYNYVLEYERLSGTKPTIYTAAGYWNQYGQNNSFWLNYKLWIANYDVSYPNIPKPWNSYTFWQFTDRGNAQDYGLDPLQKKAVDLNYYFGTHEQFNTEFNLDGVNPPVDPPPCDGEPPQAETHSGMVSVSALNVRTCPSTSTGTIIGQLTYGNVFTFKNYGVVDNWEWCYIMDGAYQGYFCALGAYNAPPYYVAIDIPAQKTQNVILKDNSIYKKFFQHGSWVNALILNKDATVRVNVEPSKPSAAGAKYDASFVCNGGDFDMTTFQPVGLCVSEGVVKGVTQDVQPFANWDKSDILSILKAKDANQAWNAIAGKRFIVENGAVSPNTSSSWDGIAARTIIAVTDSGKAMIIVIDGGSPISSGVNLYDAADIAIGLGAQTAIDWDGGGSSTLFVKELGGTVNVPTDDNCAGHERTVGSQLLVYSKLDNSGGGEVEPSGKTYKVIQTVRKRYEPNLFAGYNQNDPDAVLGEEFTSIGTSQDTKPVAGVTDSTTIWEQMPDGMWVLIETLRGTVYLEEIAPPNPDPKVVWDIQVKDDGTLWINGKQYTG